MSRYRRQQDIVDGYRLAVLPITVIGAGATGSFITLALAKMGAGRITVYDDDTVSDHNLPNQFYRVRDIGRPKVAALAEIVMDFADVALSTKAERFCDQPVEGVVVVCVDSMDQRQQIWRRVRFAPQVPLLVDTRMGAEVAVVCAINPIDPDDVRAYEESLCGSTEAFQARCTERAIVCTALGIAALACGKVKKYVMAQPYRRMIVRDFRLSVMQ